MENLLMPNSPEESWANSGCTIRGFIKASYESLQWELQNLKQRKKLNPCSSCCMILNITVDINVCCKNSHPFPAVQHSSVSVNFPPVHHFSLMVVINGSCSALGEIQQSQMLVCPGTVGEKYFSL